MPLSRYQYRHASSRQPPTDEAGSPKGNHGHPTDAEKSKERARARAGATETIIQCATRVVDLLLGHCLGFDLQVLVAIPWLRRRPHPIPRFNQPTPTVLNAVQDCVAGELTLPAAERFKPV